MNKFFPFELVCFNVNITLKAFASHRGMTRYYFSWSQRESIFWRMARMLPIVMAPIMMRPTRMATHTLLPLMPKA